MKDVGAGVWWVDVLLAGQSGVTRRNHAPEQFIVERAGDAAAAMAIGDDDPIHIDEVFPASPEPLKIHTVIDRLIVKGDQQRRSATNARRCICRLNQRPPRVDRQERCFFGVGVVERQQCRFGTGILRRD